MLPIQQHTGIYQYTTPYHSAEQRRARKGGARGGKTGFATLSAFPLANFRRETIPVSPHAVSQRYIHIHALKRNAFNR